MSNLSVTIGKNTEIRKGQTLSGNLTKTEIAAIFASKMPKVLDSESILIAKTVTEIVSIRLINLGRKAKEKIQDRQALENMIHRAICLNFGNLSLKEIQTACEMGTLGAFRKTPDEYLGIDPVYICSYIRAYIEQVRRNAVAKIVEPEQKKEVDEAKITREWLQDVFVKPFQAKKPINDRYGVLFDFFTENGLFSPCNELKVENYTIVSKRLKSSLRKSAMDKNEWLAIDEYRAEGFEAKPIAERKKNQFYNEAVRMSKEKMFLGFVADCIEMEIDLVEELKSKGLIV